jgi:hypothetical protein
MSKPTQEVKVDLAGNPLHPNHKIVITDRVLTTLKYNNDELTRSMQAAATKAKDEYLYKVYEDVNVFVNELTNLPAIVYDAFLFRVTNKRLNQSSEEKNYALDIVTSHYSYETNNKFLRDILEETLNDYNTEKTKKQVKEIIEGDK